LMPELFEIRDLFNLINHADMRIAITRKTSKLLWLVLYLQ
jgi:hypothetical protein